MDDLLLWLLSNRDGISAQLGFLIASWLLVVIGGLLWPSKLRRHTGGERESSTYHFDQWAWRSWKWLTVLGCILLSIPLIAGYSGVGRPTSTWNTDESWNLWFVQCGWLVGMVFPVIASSFASLRASRCSQAGDKALDIFLSVGLYPWRAIVRFFERFGTLVAAGLGMWVALGCLNFFWPALTVILSAIVAYYLLTTTRFAMFWFVLAGWLALAQLCGLLVGIWSLFYPPRTPVAGQRDKPKDTDREEEFARKCLAKQLWEKVKDTEIPQLLLALRKTSTFFGGKGDFDQIVKEIADYPDRETVVELLALNLENTDLMDPTLSLDAAHTWGDALVAMGKDAVERLIACLDHENFWVRIVAVSALRRIGDRRAVQPLIKVLQETPSGRVASLAADALGEIAGPDPDVINALTKAVEEGDSMSRPSAKAALDQLSAKRRLLEETADFSMEGATVLNMSEWELRWHLKRATDFISYGEETSNPWEAADMLYDHAWKRHVEPLCSTEFPAAISLRDTIISDLEIAATKAEDRYGAEHCRNLAERIRKSKTE